VEEAKIPTIASLALLLVAGAVLGRLHEKGEATALGDRVMCGLLSLPLIALGVYYVAPQHSFHWALLWALVAPVPVLIYTLLLATTERYDNKQGIKGISPFTRTLLIAVGLTYLFMLFTILLYKCL
jgi:hypothetical protein